MSEANVQVAVRARPLSRREIDMKSSVVLEMREKATTLRKTTEGIAVGEKRDRLHEFVYDYSYWSLDATSPNYTSQEQVFNNLGKSVLEAAFEGYNACVFAYGQTGSGKTYTMMGTETAPGLTPRICESLFEYTATGSLSRVSYKTEASFLEIYNEKVRDLLVPPSSDKIIRGLKVREHPKDGPYVENLTKHAVSDYQSIEDLMNIGNTNRVTASTKMNDVSSRSHAIFTVTFTQATYSADLPCETVSKINLVDLAGSERVSATGAEGIRLKEGGNINKSLVCLGNVISALAEISTSPNSHRKFHIPYRDSVLTWLLKDSLGGNSKTIMIATVSPAECNYGETLSTLRYASRAKNIVNKPVVNEDPNVRLIRELRAEITRLKLIIEKGQLQDVSQPGKVGALMTEMFSEDIQRKENQIAELTKTWAGKWEDIQTLLEESKLALHSEGIKMTVASEHPHFIAVDNDALSMGVVIYHIKNEITTIGAAGSNPRSDIELSGLDIEGRHCEVDCKNKEVFLTPINGSTCVNMGTIYDKTKLTHGDIVQLGSSAAFRFNYPHEAIRHEAIETNEGLEGKGRFLELTSPLSSQNTLEEQRLAIEKHYEEKLEALRKEMEMQKEQENSRLKQELEKLKSTMQVHLPNLPLKEDMSLTSDDNDPYNIMKSVALKPVIPKRSCKSLRVRDITGNYDARNIRHSFSSYYPPTTNHSALSPATGQHKASGTMQLDSPDSSEMKKLIDTYEVVNKNKEGNMTSGAVACNIDIPTAIATSDPVNMDIKMTNNANFEANNVLSRSCPPVQNKNGAITSSNTATELPSELSLVEQQLDMEGGVDEVDTQAGGKSRVVMRHKRDTDQVRSLRRLSHDVELLRREKEEYSVENAELKQKLKVALANTQQDPLESKLDFARPSYSGSKSKGHLRRANSMSAMRSQFKCTIQNHYIRGKGMTKYHIYEILVQLGEEKWVIHRRYNDFQRLHDDLKRRYPMLSTLALPPSKWIGYRKEEFVQQRRQQLENYLQSLLAVLDSLQNSPLIGKYGKRCTKEELVYFSAFFCDEGVGFASVKRPYD